MITFVIELGVKSIVDLYNEAQVQVICKFTIKGNNDSSCSSLSSDKQLKHREACIVK